MKKITIFLKVIACITCLTLQINSVNANQPYTEDEEDYTVGQNGSAFVVFPNPTDGQLTIKMSDRYRHAELVSASHEIAGDAESSSVRNDGSGCNDVWGIEIFDVLGRNQKITLNSPLSTLHSIDVSHFPSGVYFIRITTENGAEVQKFVKR